jgi:hypothetical protein
LHTREQFAYGKKAGWKNLVEKFPAPEIERLGNTFRKQTGYIGRTEFERAFAVQLIQEGLLVRPVFAARSPVLIPWSKVMEVAVSGERYFGRAQNILLTLEWEKQLQFSLPPAVLPTVEKNVPADRLRKVKVPLLFDLLKERWNKRRS